MQTEKTTTKPSIVIFIVPYEGNETILRELQAGMEEEAVPYSILKSDEPDNVALAFRGANVSLLGVGVGISPNGICVHYRKLPKKQPLFSIGKDSSPKEWRHVGYNAARLVKGLPFKDMPSQEQDPAPDMDTAKLYQLVREIVIKLKQEFAEGPREVKA